MNQQCKVCGEPAAGFHFGAFTCEGCKSFFGRTYNNLSSVTECKNNGECIINKKNRTACKACRLRKCLLVGMSKSGSRYGRRSNWFKIHCLLQEQQQNGNSSIFGNAPGLFPSSFLPNHLLSPEKLFASAALGMSKKEETHSESGDSSNEDDTRSTSTLSFLRPPSSHHTPSPLTCPVTLNLPPSPACSTTNSRLLLPSPNRFYPPTILTKPPMLGTWPTPGLPHGGDLLLCSPALAGVAVEQDHPIDLSTKTSKLSYNSPPTPLSNRGSECGSDVDDNVSCKETLYRNNPIDLTAKRVEVPQSG